MKAFPQASINGQGIPEISADQVAGAPANVRYIDVRRPDEYTGSLGHVKNAKLITLETDFRTWVEQADAATKEIPHVFICLIGGRSNMAASMAMTLGFRDVYNLQGGMRVWNELGLPVEK